MRRGGMVDKGGNAVHRHSEGCHPLKNLQPLIPVVIGEVGGEVWCVQKQTSRPSENMLLRCVLDAEKREEWCGAWHFQFQEEIDDFHRSSFDPKKCVCGLMMQHSTNKTMYYTVRMDWKELIHDSSSGRQVFAMPRQAGAYYSSYEE